MTGRIKLDWEFGNAEIQRFAKLLRQKVEMSFPGKEQSTEALKEESHCPRELGRPGPAKAGREEKTAQEEARAGGAFERPQRVPSQEGTALTGNLQVCGGNLALWLRGGGKNVMGPALCKMVSHMRNRPAHTAFKCSPKWKKKKGYN